MNRISILFVLLIMFLSCGNSSTDNAKHKYDYLSPRGSTVSKKLNRSQKIMAGKLDQFFADMNRKGIFNGSVIVSRAGKVIFKKALGFANKSTKNILTDSSMFQLASVTKVITAIAVLMLHERNQIDINKPFCYYFPDFPYKDVLVKQLLNHRSGLPNYIYTLNAEFYLPNYKMSNTDMYNYFVSKNTARYQRPNTRFNYSNTNYAL